MKVIIIKLLKDFQYAKGKFILLVLAASLSSWGISAVMYGYFMTERDFEENFKSTYPADITITIDHYQKEVLDAVLADKNVIDVERREVIYGRVKGSRDSWMPLVLYIIDDVEDIRIDRVRIADSLNLEPGNLLIERNADFFIEDGQKEIELIPGKGHAPIKLEIDGFVHDPRQAPAQMERIVYAYATSIKMFEEYLPDSTRRLLIETDQSADLEMLQLIYDRLEQLITNEGASIVKYNIPPPGEHIHQGVVDGIAFMQKTGGGVLAVMGIILLSLILLTWLLPQFQDIGVMKAIGASTFNISQAFVSVLIFILLVGLIIGMPLGYLTGYFYNKAVAFFQNFEMVEEFLPIQYHILVFVASLFIPLLFGFTPLLKASRVSVRNAMNQTFYMVGSLLFKWTQKLKINSRYQYGLNNLFRHTQRTILLALLMVIGTGLYFTSINIDYSIRRDLEAHSKTSDYELLLGFPQQVTIEQINFLNTNTSIKDYIPISSRKVFFNLNNSEYEEQGRIRYLSSRLKIKDEYLLRGEIRNDCANCLYVTGEQMAELFEQIEIGEQVQLITGEGEVESFVLTGVIKDLVVLGAPFLVFDDQRIQEFNALAIELIDDLSYQEISDISNAIDEKLLAEGIGLSWRDSMKRRIAGLLAHLAPTFLIIKVLGAFTVILGLFGLIILLNLTIQERTREIGIIKSIGASYKSISSLFNLEFLWVTLVAILIGFVLSYPLASGLISVVAESLLRRSVDQYFDYFSIIISAVLLLVIQITLIAVFNRYKINQNPRELLDFNF